MWCQNIETNRYNHNKRNINICNDKYIILCKRCIYLIYFKLFLSLCFDINYILSIYLFIDGYTILVLTLTGILLFIFLRKSEKLFEIELRIRLR